MKVDLGRDILVISRSNFTSVGFFKLLTKVSVASKNS